MTTSAPDLVQMKREGKRFAMLTAWDSPTAQMLEEAGVRVILAGDTLAMTMLGHPTTLPVTLDEMIHHTKAVVRGAPNALVVGDMPFGSYEGNAARGIDTAVRFMKETGVRAVKFEGPDHELAHAIVARGIPLMGHLGLTPQSVHAFGGFKVQARAEDAARALLSNARALEEAGAFAVVLEAVPWQVGRTVTEALSIPTIGIGAGPHCDGQVLVTVDLLGLWRGRAAKFVKTYAELQGEIKAALEDFLADVEAGRFPDPEHSYA